MALIEHHVQGPVLLNSIPQHSDRFGSNLRQDLCTAVGGKEALTNNPNGVSKIMNFMRAKFEAENKFWLGFLVFKEFYECKRNEGQRMKPFIHNFDRKYRVCKMFDVDFQDKMLYVILLQAAKLNEDQNMVFKAFFDMEQDNLYERMKKTMITLFD